jgi:hypothetical protein
VAARGLGEIDFARSSHQRPKFSTIAATITPSPGAANGVVPKNGVGIAFWIADLPGSIDMVKVEVPKAIAAGIRRRRIAADPEQCLRHRRHDEEGDEKADAAVGLEPLRQSMDAGANASVLPAVSVASLVGFGAVVAALPTFALVREWALGIGGGPLVSLAAATNILAALTGSVSGGLTIALDALGDTYMRLAAEQGIDPALLHRVAAIGSSTLDSLPHNGAVVTLLAVCGVTHWQRQPQRVDRVPSRQGSVRHGNDF